jgi:hypothetical protein
LGKLQNNFVKGTLRGAWNTEKPSSLEIDSRRKRAAGGMQQNISVICTGYLDENIFQVVSCYRLLDDGSFFLDSVMNPSSLVDTLWKEDLVIKSCNRVNSLEDNWRVVYPGNQTSIFLFKRPKFLSHRTFDISSAICVAHKMIANDLSKAAETGLELVIIIKSAPFEFYRNLVNVAACVFLKEESWEEDEDAKTYVNLESRYNDNEMFGADLSKCDYSEHEPIMDVHMCGDLSQCINIARKKNPVQYNSSELNAINVPEASRCILLDFYEQDPEGCPIDCEYVSVVGDSIKQVCEQRSWGLIEGINTVNLNGSDLYKLCDALDQSLNNIHVVCTDVIRPYIKLNNK